MAVEDLKRDVGAWGRWRRRIKGAAYVGFGAVFALFALVSVSAAARIYDYYYVPHACQALECRHDIETAADGRTHCAAFPPKDIKISEVSPAYVKFCQFMVACCGAAGLACAVLTVLLGMQWLFGIRVPGKDRRWYVVMQRAVPVTVFLLPVFSLCFMWPYGIVPM
ncbi:MAG: hypothetical protein JRK53_28150 [Deltaproteobacteria bacterium]|nr:hypothetical protein [Deltaproteobacteria bacterium]